MPQTPLTAVLANALAVSSFLANFRLTSERPLALFFDTKKHIQVVPEIFTATGNSVCCLQRIGKKPLPHFHIFLLPTFLQTAKSKTLKTPLTAVLANAMVAKSTVVAAEWNKVFGFSLKNVYYFIK